MGLCIDELSAKNAQTELSGEKYSIASDSDIKRKLKKNIEISGAARESNFLKSIFGTRKQYSTLLQRFALTFTLALKM